MLKIAVVILNWNGKHFLEKFLENILNCSDYPGAKIIIADNGSTDDSVPYIKERFSDIRLIEFEKNHGYAFGYYKALKQIEAEYFVLLNSDVEVTPNWIEPIIRCMDENKNIAAAMPLIKDYQKKTSFEYAGAAGGFIDKFGFPFCRGRILYKIEEDKNQYNENIDIFWASGACMFVRSEAYFNTGGLDGDFFAHMEEIDLCWRLKRLGYRIVVCPKSEIYHVGGGTLPNNSPRKLYLNYRNSLYLLYKNLARNKFHRTIAVRLGIDWFTAFIYLARFDFNFFRAVFRAHRHFIEHLPKLRNKRKCILEKSTVENVSDIYNRSIIYNFFVRRKRFFKDLNPTSFSN